MEKKYTQFEIYNHLYNEVYMKKAFQVTQYSPDNFLEIASREAHLHAVKNTWHWFNNQEAFIKNAFYLIKK